MSASARPRRVRTDRVRVALVAFTLLFFTFLIAPILIVVVSSFSADSFITFPVRSWSLRWYWRVVEYRPFLASLATSLELAVTSAFLAAVLGVPAGLALARARGRLAMAAATLLVSPISIPAIVLGFSLLYYLSAFGFGVAFLPLLVAHTVVSIPYVSRTVIAVYRGLAPELQEAAAILGAGPWPRFRLVTLPLIRPGIFAGAMFAMLISIDNLPLSFFFGDAVTNTLPVVMLSYMQNQFDPAIGAISTIQMAIAVAALLVVERLYGLKALSAG